MIKTESLKSFYRFYSFMLRRRRIYIAISILIALVATYSFILNKPITANAYICSVAVNNNDNNSNLVLSNSVDTYQPFWQIKNPYNTNNLYKQYQSTTFLRDAAEKINYRVRYIHKGNDIYPQRPIDLYVLDCNEENYKYNHFTIYARIQKDGVVISNISGEIDKKNISNIDDIYIKYGEETSTPIGKILVKKINTDRFYDKRIKVTYSTEQTALSIFDSNMHRSIYQDIVGCELTSDYTLEFIKELYDSMMTSFIELSNRKLSQQYTQYINTIDKALDSATINTPFYTRLMELKEEAKANYLIINQKNLIYYVDEPYISIAKNTNTVGLYRYILVILILVLLPTIMLLTELLVRPLNINISDFPNFLKERVIYSVEKMPSDIDISNIQLILNSTKYDKFAVSSVSFRCFSSDDFVKELSEEDNKYKSYPSLDKNIEVLNIVSKDNTVGLILLINLSMMTIKRLEKLEELLIKSKINPIVVVFE